MKVFLGGTCTGHNWREQVIPKLNCDYFNPLVENWTEECRLREEEEKETCDYHLYVINGFMRGVYSIAQIVNDSHKMDPSKLVVVFYYDSFFSKKKRCGNKKLIQSLIATEKLLNDNGVTVYHYISDAVDYINSKV